MRPKERLLCRAIPKDAIRKALEEWSDRLSSWNELFTAMVVLGLVIEYLPGIARFLPTSFFSTVHAHAEPLRELGGLLVIIGVAGELGVGFRSSKIETDLREEIGQTIAEANERAANAELAAAEANRLAEQERLARVKIEEQLAERKLSAEQIERIRTAVQPFSEKYVLLTSYSGDGEAIRLLWQLIYAISPPLQTCDWHGGLENRSSKESILFGIRVLPASEEEREFAELLAEIFRKEGGLEVGPVGALSDGNATTVLVGMKPPAGARLVSRPVTPPQA